MEQGQRPKLLLEQEEKNHKHAKEATSISLGKRPEQQ